MTVALVNDDVIDDIAMLLEINVVLDNIALGVESLVIPSAVLLFTGELVNPGRDDVTDTISIVLILIVVVERTGDVKVYRTLGVVVLLIVIVTIIVVDDVIGLANTLNCELLEGNILVDVNPSGDVKITVEDVCNNSVEVISSEGVGVTTSEQSERSTLSIVNSSSLRFVVTLIII